MQAISLSSPCPTKIHAFSARPLSPSPSSLDSHPRFGFPSLRISDASSPFNVRNLRSDRCSCAVSQSALVNPTKKEKSAFDVVIVGAGIIGLTIAREFMLRSDLSVAVVDAKVPCSGATGAGQGYVWMVHKTPGNEKWELAVRSKQLWEALATSIQDSGRDPLKVLGWKKTGSLLIGRTPEEIAMLERRVELLSEAGIRAEFLSSMTLHLKEPALEVGKQGGAAFLPDDCQLDAHQTVAFIEKGNRSFASHGRYSEFYHDSAMCLIRSSDSGEIEAVETSKMILYSKKAVIISAGAWSGSLMQNLISESDIELDVPVKPRKGHLLVLEGFNLQLNHGLMEVGYIGHQVAALPRTASASAVVDQDQNMTSISMTATSDMMGNLVLGSSRQFAGFNTETEEAIINRILERAGNFFPTLKQLTLSNFSSSRKVRVGLRPYMPDGKPLIGPIPGLPKVFLATGHEGEGLSLAMGTAEMVADMVLGNTGKVNSAPFSVLGRCVAGCLLKSNRSKMRCQILFERDNRRKALAALTKFDGRSPIWLEMDSKVCVDILNEKCSCPWSEIILKTKIQQKLALHNAWKVTQIWREANKAADFLFEVFPLNGT